MHKEKITAIFDRQASTYDQKWRELAPINAALHLLTKAVLSDLPSNARVLCVGAGTGTEILYLAREFPGWSFTAVEPSLAMLEVFRSRAKEAEISDRCVFHAGYLESLPPSEPFDAATAFLVSQFILDRRARAEFFENIADRLLPQGVLVSSDLSGDLVSLEGRSLLETWLRVMHGNGVSPSEVERMREAYQRDVAVLPPATVVDIIMQGGFGLPVLFYQAGLIHAWYSTRTFQPQSG